MHHLIRTAFIITISVLALSNGHAQQMDNWPDWLKEAMAAESGELESKQIEIEAGPYSFDLPKNTGDGESFDGGWYFESGIDADTTVECYLFTGENDLATLVNNLAEINIAAVADGNGGAVDNRSVFDLDAGHLDGAPYLSIEWLYTVGAAPQALVGYTKIRAASNGALTQACTHNTVGYRESFKGVFEQFVTSTEQPASMLPPYYEEVSLQKLDGQPIGVALMAFALDEDGDTRIITTLASIIPIGPDAISTSDSTSVSWSTPDGLLINTNTADAQNGELITSLSLARDAESNWVVGGTFQGKEIEQVIAGEHNPISELGGIQVAKALFENDVAKIEFPMWISDADPTQFLQSSIERDIEGVPGEAILSMGPLSLDAQFDEVGAMLSGSMQLGASELVLERIWHRGSP